MPWLQILSVHASRAHLRTAFPTPAPQMAGGALSTLQPVTAFRSREPDPDLNRWDEGLEEDGSEEARDRRQRRTQTRRALPCVRSAGACRRAGKQACRRAGVQACVLCVRLPPQARVHATPVGRNPTTRQTREHRRSCACVRGGAQNGVCG